MRHRSPLLAIAICTVLCTPARAETLHLAPAADATIYSYTAPEAQGANGAGQQLLTGTTPQSLRLRSLLRFDLTEMVPSGATINTATLTLYAIAPPAAAQSVSIHPLRTAWGEAGSIPVVDENVGAPAQTGDATWLYPRFNTAAAPWSTPGGDFASGPASATQTVATAGAQTWSSAALTATVQAWLDDPASNHGWILQGDESTFSTQVRFASRQHVTPALHPQLTLTYAPATAEGEGEGDGEGVEDCTLAPDSAGALAALYAAPAFGLDPASADGDPDAPETGNGIPDHAELSLLDAVLATPESPGHCTIAANYAFNLAQVDAALELVDPIIWVAVQPRAVFATVAAGLLTVSDTSTVPFALDHVLGVLQLASNPEQLLIVDPGDFDYSASIYLAALGDADGAGASNACEYTQAAGNDPVPYVTAALDPENDPALDCDGPAEGEGEGEGETDGEGEGEGEGATEAAPHSADVDGNFQMSLSELLRVIQFYNAGALHVQAGTEDGYAPGPGPQSGAPHTSDYAPADWAIRLSELLRAIQFYNAPLGSYHPAPGTEDGFAPGAA